VWKKKGSGNERKHGMGVSRKEEQGEKKTKEGGLGNKTHRKEHERWVRFRLPFETKKQIRNKRRKVTSKTIR
jgi:hypothetical protein